MLTMDRILLRPRMKYTNQKRHFAFAYFLAYSKLCYDKRYNLFYLDLAEVNKGKCRYLYNFYSSLDYDRERVYGFYDMWYWDNLVSFTQIISMLSRNGGKCIYKKEAQVEGVEFRNAYIMSVYDYKKADIDKFITQYNALLNKTVRKALIQYEGV